MTQQLDDLISVATRELEDISDFSQLEAWRVRHLGKKSQLTTVLRGLSSLSLEERKAIGARANEVKTLLEKSFTAKEQTLREASYSASTTKK